MTSRFIIALATLASTFTLGACSDPVSVKAALNTRVDTLAAYALTGTATTLPTAVDFSVLTDSSGVVVRKSAVVRAGSDFAFDIAFDIDTSGNAIVLPARRVANSFGSARHVGLIKDTVDTFEQVTAAPASGYTYDSVTVTARPGQVVIAETTTPACTAEFYSTIYAKLVVDSVRLSDRRIFFRLGLDPNCGFRSFAPGIPSHR
jgi:hypothetical protein